MEKLIRTYNGDPFVVSAMHEIPLESHAACIEFGRRLLAGDFFDLVIFLTGISVTKTLEILGNALDREAVLAALWKRDAMARGLKPLSALRELQIPVMARTSEPST